MSQDLGTIYYEIDAKADGLLTQSKAVDRQIEKTEKGLSAVEKQMDKTNAASKELGGGLNLVTSALKAIAAASALREIAGLVQGYQEMADRVRLATSSTQEFQEVQARLVQTANGTYRSLAEAQELFIGTAASLKAMGYTTQQALDVTDSLSYSFVTNAVNADRAKSATEAFSKSMAKGKVDADAWQTISGTVDTVVGQLAATTGKTTGEILALGAAGKITASQLSEALRNSLDDNATAAAGMANNLVDAKTRMVTALTAIFVEVENQTGAWQKLTDSIITAADWLLAAAGDADKMAAFMDTATVAITATAAIMAGRLLTAIGSYVAQQSVLIAGLVRQAIAERASATAALATAQAQLAVALSTADRVRATEAATAAQARLTAVTTVGAVAMRGFGAAMALLGGPAGVILLAVAALYTFGNTAKQTASEVDALKASLDGLTFSQIARISLNAQENIQAMNSELANAKKAYADVLTGGTLGNQERYNKNLVNARANLDDVNGRIAAQKGLIEAAAEAQDKIAKRKSFGAQAGQELGKTEPNLIAPPDLKGEEDAAKKRKTLMEANVKAVKDLEQAQKEASLSAYELAEAQGLASLNKYATPEQIQQVKDLTRAIYDKAELVKNAAAEEAAALAMQKAATAADPRTAAADKYKTDLEAYAAYKANQLITDQQYEELKNAAATQYEAERLAAQEQMFAAQSRGNAFVIDSLNALGQASTQVLSGLLSGTMSGQDAMKSLANTIFNQVLGAIVQMGIDQVKSIVMGQAAQATATASGVAQAGTLTAAYAPAAAVASVASFGGAAVAGLAAMASAIPSMLNLVGGRKTGGPVGASGVYRVNEGGAPEIFTGSNGSQYLLPNKNGQVVSNSDATGAAGAGISIQVINNSSRAQVQTEQGEDEMGKFVKFYIEDWESGGPMSSATMAMTNVQRVGT